MKTTLKKLTLPKKFEPISLEIIFETTDEAKGFRHLIQCYGRESHCDTKREVGETVAQLRDIVNQLPI